MIIPVMVLLRRIREKAAGGSEGREKMALDPRRALPRKWPRMVDKPKIGEGCWGTGGKENQGSFQAFQGLSQTFSSERAFR